MLKIIDSHAHLIEANYADRIDEMVKNFKKDGLQSVFTVAYSNKTIKQCVELANKYDSVYAIIGVHPDEIADYSSETEKLLREFGKSEKVLAIGEIGLDYHGINPNLNVNQIRNKQKEVFISQLGIAHELELPVVIHTRDAIEDTLTILESNRHLLGHGGIVHCFSEKYEDYLRIKKLGFIVSIGGVLTFKNAKDLQAVYKKIDLKDIVLETDCPYLTPEPLRGKCVNEPAFVKYVAEKLADIKEAKLEDVIKQTNENIARVFKKYKG